MGLKEEAMVLVTGLPRSGTTVIGDVLATAQSTSSLYEPMNSQVGDYRFDSAFPVVGSDDFSLGQFRDFVSDMKFNRLKLRLGLFPHDRGGKALVKIFTGGRTRVSYLKTRLNPFAGNIIWKDPFAAFCVEAAAKENIDVVVAYRPPAAIAASYKRLQWSYDIQHLWTRIGESGVATDELKHLCFGHHEGISNSVIGAVFLWNLSMHLLLGSFETCGGKISLIPTGDLPDTADGVFSNLFSKLDLKATTKTTRILEKRFRKRTEQSSVPQGHPHSQKRDLSSVNTYWKDVLSEREAEFIKLHCNKTEAAVARRFFNQRTPLHNSSMCQPSV